MEGDGAREGPDISIVVVTRNQHHPLRLCLQGIGRALQPDDLCEGAPVEVIVVDDGSFEPPDDLLDDLDFPVRVERQARGGLPAARNRGIELSRGDVVVFLDDVVVPSQDFLVDLRRELHTRPELDGFGGRITPLDVDHWAGAFFEQTGRLRHQHNTSGGWDLKAANVAYRRATLTALGGFDTSLPPTAADIDLSRRAGEEGHPLDAIDAMTVYGRSPRTVTAMIKMARNMRYGEEIATLQADRRAIRAVGPTSDASQAAHPDELRRQVPDGIGPTTQRLSTVARSVARDLTTVPRTFRTCVRASRHAQHSVRRSVGVATVEVVWSTASNVPFALAPRSSAPREPSAPSAPGEPREPAR